MLQIWKKGITIRTVLLTACFLGNHYLVYLLSRWLSKNSLPFDLTSEFDKKIPLVSWTVMIYFGCYLLWGIYYLLCLSTQNRNRSRFLCADLLAVWISALFYIFFPTTNVRPEIVGDGFFEELMRLLYQVDEANNLFPSMHCMTSWLCFVGVRKDRELPFLVKLLGLLGALAVCISTLTTYQHVFVDVIAGIALAELCFGIFKTKGMTKMVSWIDTLFFPSKEKTNA